MKPNTPELYEKINFHDLKLNCGNLNKIQTMTGYDSRYRTNSNQTLFVQSWGPQLKPSQYVI